MKKIIAVLYFISFSMVVNAQLELKINPAALLFESGQFGIEKILDKNWGIDTDLFMTSRLFYASLAGKFYLDPKIKADGIHVGVFTGLFFGDKFNGNIGIGFLGGYKTISKKGVIFEIGLGVGRATKTRNIVPYFKFCVGYRFAKDIE